VDSESHIADNLAKKVEGLTMDEQQRASADDNTEANGDGHEQEPLGVELHQLTSEEPSIEVDKVAITAESFLPQADDFGSAADQLYDDPSDEDDGEGEWITPSNVALHKSRALDLLPSSVGSKKSEPAKQMGAACMTADFAMQNVLLQMGLNLIGVEGKRIDKVKTWVLRCHACFKWVHFLTHSDAHLISAGYARITRANSVLRVEIRHYYVRPSLSVHHRHRMVSPQCKFTSKRTSNIAYTAQNIRSQHQNQVPPKREPEMASSFEKTNHYTHVRRRWKPAVENGKNAR
jgi:hypothetical protein